VKTDSNKISVLFRIFFLSLSQEHTDLPPNPPPELVKISLLTIEEIKNTIQQVKSFKAAEDNSIPTVV